VPGFVNYKKGCIRRAAASDKVYQLLAHGRLFSPGTPASSTTKTGRHDIDETLLKVALKHQKSNQIYQYQQNEQPPLITKNKNDHNIMVIQVLVWDRHKNVYLSHIS
jgi:hypothetical protein